ncbi:hypothetical protein [Nostocoides vanveenii]|uniref:Uncharacterized protein n=1 Tax=Nostocoides vanveenii TaxID=330835 RepID=A0ABN2KV71_9MICO
MEFVTAWLWYLLAFALGALVAWLVARATIEATNGNEAFADVPETRAIGGRE